MACDRVRSRFPKKGATVAALPWITAPDPFSSDSFLFRLTAEDPIQELSAAAGHRLRASLQLSTIKGRFRAARRPDPQ